MSYLNSMIKLTCFNGHFLFLYLSCDIKLLCSVSLVRCDFPSPARHLRMKDTYSCLCTKVRESGFGQVVTSCALYRKCEKNTPFPQSLLATLSLTKIHFLISTMLSLNTQRYIHCVNTSKVTFLIITYQNYAIYVILK